MHIHTYSRVHAYCYVHVWQTGASMWEIHAEYNNCTGIAQFRYVLFCSTVQININDDIGFASYSYRTVWQTKWNKQNCGWGHTAAIAPPFAVCSDVSCNFMCLREAIHVNIFRTLSSTYYFDIRLQRMIMVKMKLRPIL